MRKKTQRTIGIVIAVLVSIAMIVPSFGVLFTNSGNGGVADPNNIQGLQSEVDSLSQALQANPQAASTRLSLANTYYDLAIATSQSETPEKAEAIFKQAVAEYQEVTKTNKDVNVLTDMATAAFYGGEVDLADQTFKLALAEKPDFLNALLNYGVFLMNAKNDYMGAIAQWNTALSTPNLSADDKDRLNSFISMAQEKIQQSFEATGSIDNSNPSTSGAK